MNALGYDLTTIGNHEWDDGPEALAKFWTKLNMPVVCANVDFSKNPDLQQFVKPYHIFEDLGVGIIGYITPVSLALLFSVDALCSYTRERGMVVPNCNQD